MLKPKRLCISLFLLTVLFITNPGFSQVPIDPVTINEWQAVVLGQGWNGLEVDLAVWGDWNLLPHYGEYVRAWAAGEYVPLANYQYGHGYCHCEKTLQFTGQSSFYIQHYVPYGQDPALYNLGARLTPLPEDQQE